MTSSEPSSGRRVIVGLTGGIACYKVASVVSALVQEDVEVTGPAGTATVRTSWITRTRDRAPHLATCYVL